LAPADKKHWARVGLKIHDPKNLRWWVKQSLRAAAHEYNLAWDRFFRANPYATLLQIQDFAKELMGKSGF
jgi:transposase